MNVSEDSSEKNQRIEPKSTKISRHLLRLAWRMRDSEKLTEQEEDMRRDILAEFPRLGRAPLRQEIMDRKCLSMGQLDLLLNRLQSLDLLYLNPATQEIHVAYPFSTVPTRHVVRFIDWDEATLSFAQCAIDALGMHFMFRRALSIGSACEYCANPIAIEVVTRAITHYEPAATVVWVGTSRTACAATSICPTMNFFCSKEHLSDWRKNRPGQEGEVLDLGEALYVGKGIFEGMLESAPNEDWSAEAS